MAETSVSKGFFAISPKSKLVVIHDAARPLILDTQISKLLQEAAKYGAATAAKKCSDTIKRSKSNNLILETPSCLSLLMVAQALPPVASIGSMIKTSLLAIPSGIL